MDFIDSEACKSSRAHRRDRDTSLAQTAYEKKQEKKEAKRLSRSSSEKALLSADSEELSTPEKMPRQGRRRSTSVGTKNSDARHCELQGCEDVQEVVGDEANVITKHQRKLCKSAMKRQQEMERSQKAREAKAAALEKQMEEEAAVAEAEAAASRRRAAWEAREAAAMEALQQMEVVRAETEAEEAEKDALKALIGEAEAAMAALAGGPSACRHQNQDPDLEGWEIL